MAAGDSITVTGTLYKSTNAVAASITFSISGAYSLQTGPSFYSPPQTITTDSDGAVSFTASQGSFAIVKGKFRRGRYDFTNGITLFFPVVDSINFNDLQTIEDYVLSTLPSGAAPIEAAYWIATANASLTQAQNLGLLNTGLLKITISSATATASTADPGSDYIPPFADQTAESVVDVSDYVTFYDVSAGDIRKALISDIRDSTNAVWGNITGVISDQLDLATIAATGSASNLSAGTVPLARLSGITTSQLDAAAAITAAQLAITGTPTGSKYLRDDFSWQPIVSSGTVTSVSVTTANGVSGSVATATTTPAITLTLGAITPTSVNSLTITTSTGTLTIANGKTATISNTLTLTATDGSTLAIGGGGTLGTAAYTAASAYEVPLTFSTGVTRTVNTITVDTSVIATKAYADSLVVGLLDDRGNYDASGNVFPSSGGSGSAGAVLKGDLWTVSVAGTLGGQAVTAGDLVRAITDTPGQTAGNWAISETNLGYTPLNASLLSGKFYVGNGSNIGTAVTPTGDVTFDNAGVHAIGAGKVTNAMLAGSIAASKLVGSDIATVGTITTGVWNGTTIAIANGGTNNTTQVTNGVNYFDGTRIKSLATFLFDGTNLGIGATPDALLTVSKQTSIQAPVSGSTGHYIGLDANPLRVTYDTHNNASGSGTALMGRRSRGTGASPTAAQLDDVLFSINGRGYGATQYAAASTGLIAISANQNFTDAANGTYISFSTTPDGSVTAAEVARFTSAGLQLGVSGTLVGTAKFLNATSGSITVQPVTGGLGSAVLSLPAVTDTVAVLGTAQTFTGLETFTSAVTTGTGATAGTVFNYNSLTTGDGTSLSSSSVTSGNIFKITSTSTAAASSTLTGLNIAISGANASTAQTVRGAVVSVTNTNPTSGTNTALTLAASGATTSNVALNVTTGQIFTAVNGALSTGNGPAILANGTWITGGTATTTKPYALIETTSATSTGWSTSGTGLGINAASGFTGNLVDLQTNGAVKFRVSGAGLVSVLGTQGIDFSSGASSVYIYSPSTAQLIFSTNGSTEQFGINTTGGLLLSSSLFGWSSGAVSGGTRDTILRRAAAATLAQGGTDAASPVSQSRTFQNVVAGTTNTAGATTSYIASLGTSQGAPGRFHIQGGALIAASGTVQQTAIDRLAVGATKVLTNNSATTITNVTAAAGAAAGGVLIYMVEVWDGTDSQFEFGLVGFGVSNKASAFSGNTPLKFGNQQNATSGTLTVTFALSSANPAILSCNANSSLTPSTGYPRIVYAPFNLGNQAIAIQ